MWKPKRSLAKKSDTSDNSGEFKYRCHRCGIIGYKAADCTEKQDDDRESAKKNKETILCASVNSREEHRALRTTSMSHSDQWCVDNGAT